MKDAKYVIEHTTHLDSFRVGDKHYSHVIDTKNDSTYIIDEDNNILFTVNSDAYAYDADGERIGKFHYVGTATSNNWRFVDTTNTELKYFPTWDLIKSETQFFKELLSAK